MFGYTYLMAMVTVISFDVRHPDHCDQTLKATLGYLNHINIELP